MTDPTDALGQGTAYTVSKPRKASCVREKAEMQDGLIVRQIVTHSFLILQMSCDARNNAQQKNDLHECVSVHILVKAPHSGEIRP